MSVAAYAECAKAGRCTPAPGSVDLHPGADAESGVKDLAGGVWEWTSSSTVVFADSRGRGGSPARIARGGGWADVDPANLTAGIRVKYIPTRRSPDLGFRCARDP